MEELMTVASYIFNRYKKEYRKEIDEMKLHKLLYFAQREMLIQNNEPLFDTVFYGWKYGPILKEICSAYKENSFYGKIPDAVTNRLSSIMDKIFTKYAPKNSWSLSRLTRGEIAWKNSRVNILEEENGDNPINIEYIKKDAERVRERRRKLSYLKTYINMNSINYIS